MSFWDLSNGSKASGNADDAFVASMGIIPDGTKAEALIQKFSVDSTGEKPFINVQWKLTSGEFKGRVVFQKIHCWDDKATKADRAKNMLLLICKLGGHAPTHGGEPTDKDFAPLIGKTLGIKIAEWNMIGNDGQSKSGNFISEVHARDGFESVSGERRWFLFHRMYILGWLQFPMTILGYRSDHKGLNMDIDKLRQVIKSNLVSFNLTPEDIEKITEHLLEDLLKLNGENND